MALKHEVVKCAGCNLKLILKPDPHGCRPNAYHPTTNESCGTSQWGSYVCSDACDSAADRIQENSIDAYCRRFEYENED